MPMPGVTLVTSTSDLISSMASPFSSSVASSIVKTVSGSQAGKSISQHYCTLHTTHDSHQSQPPTTHQLNFFSTHFSYSCHHSIVVHNTHTTHTHKSDSSHIGCQWVRSGLKPRLARPIFVRFKPIFKAQKYFGPSIGLGNFDPFKPGPLIYILLFIIFYYIILCYIL